MNAFGLTGNIGCGKSTVASILMGYPNVLALNCDRIAKDIIMCRKYAARIEKILGIKVRNAGKTDFRAIARVIFSDAEKKRQFEKLTHPLVWKEVERIVNSAGANKICIVESAIIFETASEGKFLGIITAVCSEQERFRRLRKIRKMTDEEIRRRAETQMSQEEKAKRSQFVIDTECTLTELASRVKKLHDELKEKGAKG